MLMRSARRARGAASIALAVTVAASRGTAQPVAVPAAATDTSVMEFRFPSGTVTRWHGDTVWRTYPPGRELGASRTIFAADSVFATIWNPSGARMELTWHLRGDSAYLVGTVDSLGAARTAPETGGATIRAYLLTRARDERAIIKREEEFRARLGLPRMPVPR
jgi:hypothetical protein